MTRSGVYMIKNRRNNKLYVGSSTICVTARMNGHRKLLRDGKHRNRHLQSAWNKYGEDAFVFVVMVRCLPDLCLGWEQHYINKFRSADPAFGYNVSPTAGNTRGVVYPEEVRQRMSEGIAAAHARPEVKAKHAARRADPEFKARHAAAMRKVLDSPEYRAKMSESCRRAQADPLVKAAVLAGLRRAVSTPEYREKQRIAATGRKHSPETLAKMRASNTPEVRGKKRLAGLGKKRSEETRRKMSEGRRACMTDEVRERMREGARKGWVKRKQGRAGMSEAEQFRPEKLG